MAKNSSSAKVVNGNIDSEKIYNTHQQIKAIVEAYKNVNADVAEITTAIKNDWVGEGRNEFEAQYNILIRKIDDFGDTLKDIYDALVQAEADYRTGDTELQSQYKQILEG